jgi:enoyl-CoA hydratase/carnithine racemase
LYGKQDGVALITINRPAKLNALTGRTLEELSAALRNAAVDQEVGVVVLMGAGDRAFVRAVISTGKLRAGLRSTTGI